MSELSTGKTETTIENPAAEIVSVENAPAPEKLYANKYKTPEDLEGGYLEAQRLITEKSTKLKEFEAPENYAIEIGIDEGTKERLTAIAKEAGLSQSQFNKVIVKFSEAEKLRSDGLTNAINEVKSELGDEKITRLDAYLDQNFPASVSKLFKEQYKTDKALAKELYAHRESALNFTVPTGISSAAKQDGQGKLREIAKQMAAHPHNAKLREQFESLALTLA